MSPFNLATTLLGGAGDGDRAALRDDHGAVVTYTQLAEQVARVRGGFRAAGVTPGDRVAVALGNRAEFVVVYLALLGLGAVTVPINPESPDPERAGHLARTQTAHTVGDPTEVPGGEPLDAIDVAPDTLAVLCETAGTSGPSRAAMLSHGNLAAALAQMGADPRTSIAGDDVVDGTLPLFHIFGLNVALGRSLASGAEIRLHDRFDATTQMDDVTVVFGVPPMFDAWATAGTQFPRARVIVSGAAPLRAATVTRFEKATGRTIAQGYGLTEASPTVTSGLLLGDPDPLSVGVPLPGVEVCLVDEDGAEVLIGDPGEIWVRGPNVFMGYDGDPDATARVLESGWLHTGDVGVLDEKGRLYVVDREKDVIIVSGFNVFPGEVEEVIGQHPGVEAVAVIGVPDDSTGEGVKAVVVKADGADVTAEGVVEWCHARLARYKAPHLVEFADSLPVLRTGKVLRRRLI